MVEAGKELGRCTHGILLDTAALDHNGELQFVMGKWSKASECKHCLCDSSNVVKLARNWVDVLMEFCLAQLPEITMVYYTL